MPRYLMTLAVTAEIEAENDQAAIEIGEQYAKDLADAIADNGPDLELEVSLESLSRMG